MGEGFEVEVDVEEGGCEAGDDDDDDDDDDDEAGAAASVA
jgi:hypothetical protein